MDAGEALSEGYMCLEDFPIPSEWRNNFDYDELDRQFALNRRNSLNENNGRKQDPNEIVF
jgi:hypothetical protein